MLAAQGHKVVLVDADPQCNLSGLILGYSGESEFEAFYANDSQRNIRSGLQPAFESQPKLIEPVECVPVPGRTGLFLLPGHIRLSEYEVTLGISQELSASIQALQNLPGSISFLIDRTAEHHQADFVIIDMNPSLSSINQNLLMTSDFFIVPTSPDYFSLMAIDSLGAVLPRWHAWSERAKTSPVLQASAYPYPSRTPRLLGTVIQKFRPRKGAPTEGFQQWIDSINQAVATRLVPSLRELKMTLPQQTYDRIPKFSTNYCLAQVADFNTLIAISQDERTPVFALSDEQLGHVGIVLEGDKKKRDEFRTVFDALAQRISTLTEP
jgi:cellulose biosynthesis protein BcsQ